VFAQLPEASCSVRFVRRSSLLSSFC
jgi:hypothetical protein